MCRVLHRFPLVKTLHHYFFGTLDEWRLNFLNPQCFHEYFDQFFSFKLWLTRMCRVFACFSLPWKHCIITFGTQIGTLNESMSWFLVPWPPLSISIFSCENFASLTFGIDDFQIFHAQRISISIAFDLNFCENHWIRICNEFFLVKTLHLILDF